MKKFILILLGLFLASTLHGADITSGPFWDNVAKSMRYVLKNDGTKFVAETPKQYVGGSVYNGVTLSVSGFNTHNRSVFIPYRTIDGAWRLKFNISGSVTVGVSSLTITIGGIKFKNVTNYYQAISVSGGSSSALNNQAVTPNADTIFGIYASSQTQWNFSGDVELDSKPTWAD